MEEASSSSISSTDKWSMNLPLLITILITITGWAISANTATNKYAEVNATTSGKINDLGRQLNEFKSRYDKEIVPRGEQELRNKETEHRLDKLDEKMEKILTRLDDMQRDMRESSRESMRKNILR